MVGEIYKELQRILKELNARPEEPSEYTLGYIDCLKYFMDLIEDEELLGE